MSSRKHEEEILTIRIPRNAWETLSETLALDAKSISCDKALRDEIAAALRQVHEVGEPCVLVGLYGGVPSKVEVYWDEAAAIKAARKEVKSMREDEDIVTVRHGDVHVYGWPED